MANDMVPLATLAKEINACDDKCSGYERKAEEFRATRNAKIIEAHTRIVTNKETDQSWADWCEENLTIQRNAVAKIVRAVKSPQAEPQEKNGIPEYQNDPVEPEDDDPWFDKDDGDFVGSAPSTYVIEPEVVVDPVEAIMTRVKALSTEEFKRLLAAIGQEAIALGLAKPKAEPRVRVVPPKEEPNPRVVRAVELFFLLPEAKQHWAEQRMDDEPERVAAISVQGPHVDWAKAFVLLPKDEANAIVSLIHITRDRSRK